MSDKKIIEETKEEVSSSDFIKEKIKERPINKKRLTKKMLFTASTAVIFGSIACLSFLLLEPVFEKYILGKKNNGEQLTQVVLEEVAYEDEGEISAVINDAPFEENIVVEETPIENLNLDEENNSDGNNDTVSLNTIEMQIEPDDFQHLYRKMYALSAEVSKSVVIVTGAKRGQDVLSGEYLNTNRTYGLIIAENGNKLLILADGDELPGDNFTVTFCEGSTVEAEKAVFDKETGLTLFSVNMASIPAKAKEKYTIATLGSTGSASLMGSPIIALGDPLNTGSSVCYGTVSSLERKVYAVDSAYQLITTDIYASKKARGIIINVRGQVIGIICQHKNSGELQNLITAYGISGIKNLIENMSNSSEIAYVGVHLKDISNEARLMYNIPSGVYITKVEIDSPAMNVGLGSGDIICSINGKTIITINDYMNELNSIKPGQTATVGVMRLNGDEYYKTEIKVKVEDKREVGM